ncbi:HWE histidine kinase domain-containing protein [Altererythrobacter lutimaris]|uniref:histidine kinase n=1 Tax=Altererythrobacter lutimaris TaxID=2743979 RepID=A0A850HDH1_9SPHN|nr:HWE histidine kinase domain-containing protein [Altererythrobacter lutimaris]NVE95670.1 GAF domain-containing protein [Altererythrobacter lutimaris]
MSEGPRRYELTDCDREPIHILNYIQPFGGLLAANLDWTIAYHSDNASDMLGFADDAAGKSIIRLGAGLDKVLRPSALERIKSSLFALETDDSVERIFAVELVNDLLFDCAIHRTGSTIVIDFEPHSTSAGQERPFDLLGPLTSQLETTHDLLKICRIGAAKLKSILGYDRVMVYRFHADGTGEVIAEEREAELESFLGLRYPRTDIPEQARALYLRNRFRIIADIEAEPVAILPKGRFGAEPLDLSMSTLRAVSPIHIQYLKNMGVGASLSISIVHQGKLWGLFACHHYSAKPLPFATRTTAELFSQLFSLALDRALLRKSETIREEGRRLHDQLMVRLAQGRTLIENLPMLDEMLTETIAHDGMSIFADGVYRARGAAPDREEFEAMLPALNGSPPGKIISSDSIAKHISTASAFADRVAGALIIPISRNPRDYLVLWRRELPQKVVWGGNPDKAVTKDKRSDTLTPRSSFAAWEQRVSNHSERWNSDDLQIAEGLRTSLLEIILKMTDDAERERRKSQEQQSLLIAELNHRVRNILNLIRSLVDQSKHEAIDVTQFVDIVRGRISALATAHENITRENWAPAPVSKLIEAEAKAYLNGKSDRLRLSGEDVLVSPQAYTVLALVLHEMVTNSAKYGSLCDRRGELEIALTRSHDGDLVIDWKEIGGPPVKEPTRRGFGSTIIERSIPFELKGETKVDFKPSGLEAHFRIPATYIEEGGALLAVDAGEVSIPQRGALNAASSGDASSLKPNHVLLVEDSMIIALDTAEILRGHGIDRVSTCSTVAGAIEAIESAKPDFALVDFNLGAETSEPIISELRGRGIPFVLATGYGDVSEQASELGAAGVLQKPYDLSDILRVVPGLSD